MYKRDMFLRFGGYITNIKWCADWLLFCQFAAAGRSYVIPDLLYHRMVARDGVTFSPHKALDQIRSSLYVKHIVHSKPASELVKPQQSEITWQEIEKAYPLDNFELQGRLLSKFLVAVRLRRSDAIDYYLPMLQDQRPYIRIFKIASKVVMSIQKTRILPSRVMRLLVRAIQAANYFFWIFHDKMRIRANRRSRSKASVAPQESSVAKTVQK
jgi:hypothetical protein